MPGRYLSDCRGFGANLEKELNCLENPGIRGLALLMDVAILFSSLNAFVLLGLIYLYGRLALRSRAILSVGLVIFAVFLLTQNLLTVFAYTSMQPLFGEETLPILSSTSALQFAAYVTLLKFTL